MRCERFAANGDPARTVAAIRSLVTSPASVTDAVAEIVGRVASEGDAAVLEYTRALDTGGGEPAAMRVDTVDLARAADQLDHAVRAGLKREIDKIGRASCRERVEIS